MTEFVFKDAALGYGSHPVVSKLNMSLSKGDYLCVVGENGVGKSTFIKTLLGFLPIISGTLLFPESFSRKDIGYLPQQSEYQRDFPATVKEIVLSGLAGRKRSPFFNKSEKEKAEEIMAKMGIASLADKSYRELSGGQQQRALLSRALISADKMLILDEPQTGLDPIAAGEFYEMISSLNREEKTSVIMVTHDLSASLKYASHILHLACEPLFFGKTEDYKKSEVGREFILGGGHSHD